MQATTKAIHIWRVIRRKSEVARFATDVLIHAVSQIFAQIRGLILLPLIAIGLSLTDYGIWTQISATAALLFPFLMLGLDQAAIRYLPGMHDDKDRFAESFFAISPPDFNVLFDVKPRFKI